MTIHVRCPSCSQQYGVDDDRAGKTAKCPACGEMARIPDVDPAVAPYGPPGGPSQDPYEPPQTPISSGMPNYAGVDPYAEADRMKFEVHRRVIGILMIVAGVLTVLWGGLMVLSAVMVSRGMIPLAPNSPPEEQMIASYIGMAVPSFGSAAFQLVGGTLLLVRTRRCRVWGIIAAVASCCSIWSCCVIPVNLGIGIYALVILCSSRAGDALRSSG